MMNYIRVFLICVAVGITIFASGCIPSSPQNSDGGAPSDSRVDAGRPPESCPVPPESCPVPSESCPPSMELCAGQCVDLNSTIEHCGACGNACTGGRLCVDGDCQCPQGMTFCNGACVDVLSNSMHCGACGNICATDALCSGGECNPVPAPSRAIIAFYASECPPGWVAADGQNDTPDLRGLFVRGLSEGRELGSFQDDAVGSHQHQYSDWTNHCNSIDDGSDEHPGFCRNTTAFFATRTTSASGGEETRPKNIALLYCMKQ